MTVQPKTPSQTWSVIDLFSGAGGLSLGFWMAAEKSKNIDCLPVFAVEQEQAAADTFKTNFKAEVFTGDIAEFDTSEYPDAQIILAGPPCQGFSPLGRDRDNKSRAVMNQLWRHCLSAIETVSPQIFLIENVPEFQASEEFAEMLHRLNHPAFGDYQTAHGVLNAADYGVPQFRKRGFLAGIKSAKPLIWPPPPTHGGGELFFLPYSTAHDAIGDLPKQPTTDVPVIAPNGQQDLHISRNPTAKSLERYKVIPEGGNRFDLQAARPDLTPKCWLNKPTGTTDVMGRMWWNKPSHTIRTEFYKPEKGRYLHPTENRPITHREAARLQSFPDHFVFSGTKQQIARQIGNAVPPKLAAAIGTHLLRSVNCL